MLTGCSKGISGSSIPYSRRAPTWLKSTTEEATELICKLAKKGLTPSQIGVILRDSHGVGQIKALTGSKIVRILRASGTAEGLVRVPHLCGRIGSPNPRGHVLSHQEGRRRAQAP